MKSFVASGYLCEMTWPRARVQTSDVQADAQQTVRSLLVPMRAI